MCQWTRLAVQNHSHDDRDQGSISHPCFPLEDGHVCKPRSKEWSGCADSLVEGNWQKLQRDISAYDREAEDDTEGRDLEELHPRTYRLQE